MKTLNLKSPVRKFSTVSPNTGNLAEGELGCSSSGLHSRFGTGIQRFRPSNRLPVTLAYNKQISGSGVTGGKMSLQLYEGSIEAFNKVFLAMAGQLVNSPSAATYSFTVACDTVTDHAFLWHGKVYLTTREIDYSGFVTSLSGINLVTASLEAETYFKIDMSLQAVNVTIANPYGLALENLYFFFSGIFDVPKLVTASPMPVSVESPVDPPVMA